VRTEQKGNASLEAAKPRLLAYLTITFSYPSPLVFSVFYLTQFLASWLLNFYTCRLQMTSPEVYMGEKVATNNAKKKKSGTNFPLALP